MAVLKSDENVSRIIKLTEHISRETLDTRYQQVFEEFKQKEKK